MPTASRSAGEQACGPLGDMRPQEAGTRRQKFNRTPALAEPAGPGLNRIASNRHLTGTLRRELFISPCRHRQRAIKEITHRARGNRFAVLAARRPGLAGDGTVTRGARTGLRLTAVKSLQGEGAGTREADSVRDTDMSASRHGLAGRRHGDAGRAGREGNPAGQGQAKGRTQTRGRYQSPEPSSSSESNRSDSEVEATGPFSGWGRDLGSSSSRTYSHPGGREAASSSSEGPES